MNETVRQLSLVKGQHKYLFRYRPGDEAQVIGAFASLAADAGSEFDWFDAAVLSYQMGRRIELELDELRA
jgi:hypothetical protein